MKSPSHLTSRRDLGRQHLKWARVQGWPLLTAGRAAQCSKAKKGKRSLIFSWKAIYSEMHISF